MEGGEGEGGEEGVVGARDVGEAGEGFGGARVEEGADLREDGVADAVAQGEGEGVGFVGAEGLVFGGEEGFDLGAGDAEEGADPREAARVGAGGGDAGESGDGGAAGDAQEEGFGLVVGVVAGGDVGVKAFLYFRFISRIRFSRPPFISRSRSV